MSRSTNGRNTPTQDRIIADALIEDIVEWRIPPGTWLREREIAKRFDVSHAPVREAFRHVAHIGFIQVVPWRGAHVIELERHASMQVLELWKANFGVVSRHAATAMSKAEADELLAMLRGFTAFVQSTSNTFAQLQKGIEIGQFISGHSGAHLAADIMARITLFARWQHHVVRDPDFTGDAIHPGVRSAELYEALGLRIAARDQDGAQEAAHALISFHQSRYGMLLDSYFAERRNDEGSPGSCASPHKSASG